MSPKFCHNCGKPASSGWKACPFCETSFASLSEKPKQYPKAQEPTIALVGRNEDGDDDDYLDHQEHFTPKIQSLAVEIERPRQSNKESIQDLATNPFSSVSTDPRIAPPSISPEEAIRQFQQEAGNVPRQK